MSQRPADNRAERTRLTIVEAQTALQQMDNAAKPADAKARRMRIPYTDQQVVLETEEGAGRKIRQALQGRNLSTFGLAAMHPQFVHSGRRCVVYLDSLETNAPVAIPAKIGRCRFVGGRVHEVAIRFEAPIDVRHFIRLNAADTRKYAAERKADNLETPETAAAKPARASGSALVVEDFESNRQLYAMWLGKIGLNALKAANSAQAEQILAEHPVNLILVDAQLGENDNGLVLARRLRARKLETPIICISADASEGTRAKAIAAGCTDFLPKPFQREELEHIAMALLRGDPYGPLQTTPIRSTLADDKDTLPLLEKFVDQVRTLADMLRTVINSNDVAGSAKICQRLTEGGTGYGFAAVSDVAKSAIATIAKDPKNLLRIRRDIDRVLHVVNRMQT